MHKFFVSTILLFCVFGAVISGCSRDEEEQGDIIGPEVNTVQQSQGVAVIHNPSGKDLSLVNRTRLVSPDGRIYRLVGTGFVPAGKKIRVIIETDHAHFDLGAGVKLSIPGLSRSEEFKDVYAITQENIDPMRHAFG